MIGQLLLVNTAWITVNYTGVNFEDKTRWNGPGSFSEDHIRSVECVLTGEYIHDNKTMYIGIEMSSKKCIHFHPQGIMEYPGAVVAKGVIASSNGSAIAQ